MFRQVVERVKSALTVSQEDGVRVDQDRPEGSPSCQMAAAPRPCGL